MYDSNNDNSIFQRRSKGIATGICRVHYSRLHQEGFLSKVLTTGRIWWSNPTELLGEILVFDKRWEYPHARSYRTGLLEEEELCPDLQSSQTGSRSGCRTRSRFRFWMRSRRTDHCIDNRISVFRPYCGFLSSLVGGGAPCRSQAYFGKTLTKTEI